MMKIKILILFLCFAAVAQSPKKALALETAPCYQEPRSDMLPRTYLGAHDTCMVDSVYIDSSNVAWFKVGIKDMSVWTPGSGLRYIAAGSEELFATRAQEDKDKFRRLKILREHEAWPRRIKNAVRAGQICLGLTSEQLTAAWDAPQEKEKLFILGIGACACWRFAATGDKACSVILQNDAVIGWSAEQ